MTRLDWPAYSAIAGTMLVLMVCLIELVMPRSGHIPVRLINVPHANARAARASFRDAHTPCVHSRIRKPR